MPALGLDDLRNDLEMMRSLAKEEGNTKFALSVAMFCDEWIRKLKASPSAYVRQDPPVAVVRPLDMKGVPFDFGMGKADIR